MDMRFHWIQDRILQEHFNVFWKPGPTTLGDYHSKHHPTPHQIQLRHTNLHEHMFHTTHCKGVLIPQTGKQLVQA